MGFTQILDFSVVNFKGVLLSPGRRAARMMPGGNDGASEVCPLHCRAGQSWGARARCQLRPQAGVFTNGREGAGGTQG